MLCTVGIWVLLSALGLIASPRWQRVAALAFALVLAAIAKLPVDFVFLTSMPLALLLMPAQERKALLQRLALTMVLAAHRPAVLLVLVVIVVAIARCNAASRRDFGLQDLTGIGWDETRTSRR